MMNAAANIAESKLGHRETAATPGVFEAKSASESMYALTWHGKEDVRYEKVPKPVINDPQDVVVRITATTICGSDLHLYAGEVPNVKEGNVLGHEGMGIVESIGKDVKTLAVGDRVVIAFAFACGTCDYCKREEFSCCDKTNPSKVMETLYQHAICAIPGFGGLTGHYSGCQSEYVRVPFGDVNCLKLPDDVPDEKALYLSDIACTSYHAAVELGQVKEGSKVIVYGAGPIGILTAKWCEVMGASQVIVIECVQDRCELVKEKVPMVEVLNPDDVPDVVKRALEMCPGGADIVIDCTAFRYATNVIHKVLRRLGLETDSSTILNHCLSMVRKAGTCVWIADYIGYTHGFNIGQQMEKHLRVMQGQCPVQKHWKKVLKAMQDDVFDPRICVTNYAHMSDGPELYKKFHHKEDGVVKTFLRP